MEQEKDSSTLVLYVIAALLLVVGGAWVFLSFRQPAPTPVVAPVAPAPLKVPDQIDPRFALEQNLDMGQMALSAGQLVEPADGSALYFFLSALEQDRNNRVAREGLQQISASIARQAGEQLAAEDFLGLDGSLRVLRRVDAADINLLALNEQLAALVQQKLADIDGATRRAQWVPAQALIDQLAIVPGIDDDALTLRRAELAAAQTRATELAATVAAQAVADAATPTAPDAEAETPPVADAADDEGDDDAEDDVSGDFIAGLKDNLRDSLADGRLIEPATNSAAYFLSELRTSAPDDEDLPQGSSDLVAALITRADAASVDGDFAQATSLLTAASDLGVQDIRLRLAQTRLRNARAAAESQRVIPVGEMVNTKVVRPRYPARALRNNAEGYVLLNFTVLSNGTTADIVVVETSDRYTDQFTRAAQSAVGQWEFVPREFEGQIIEQRVQARVAFEIDQ